MDFRYRHSYRLRVILPAMLSAMLSAMFPSTRAQFYSLLVTTASASSMTAVPPTRHHCHPLFMIGSTPCLNIVMLLMGIDMMFMESHHGYRGNLHRSGSPPWEHDYEEDLHRGGSGPPWPWRTWSMAMGEPPSRWQRFIIGAWLWGEPPSQSQRSTISMTGMKHGYGGGLHRGRSGSP